MSDYKIAYSLSIPEPHSHYVNVEMSIENIRSAELNVNLPTWTPGSYMIREYSKNIVQIQATDGNGRIIKLVKLSKNAWQLNTVNIDSVTLSYKVYANEETVRTSVVDADHAHLTPASIFLFIEDNMHLPASLTIDPPKQWKEISTPLKRNGKQKWVRKIQNYDELVDSPIEIGNHDVIKFEAGGIPHELALVGPSNADIQQVVKDLKRIIDESVALMGEQPCDEYLFILQNTDGRYNGLEHLYSTSCQLPRWDFYPRDKYQQSMGLLSHEYFHLWNVKRMRPEALGPFDYGSENYTKLLWFVEGATSYYDDYLLYKSKIFTQQEYLDVLAKVLTHVVNTPGDTVQSLTDSSFDAWVKFYRRNENSINTEVSYYKKGATVIEAMNFIILKESAGKYSFDDVMRSLYQDYKANPEKGYTGADVLAAVERFAGKSMKRFFNDHVSGVKELNYKKYFSYVGLNLIDQNAKSESINWGWSLKVEENVSVAGLNVKYGAAQSGINVGDELIAINGFRVTKDYLKLIERVKVGESISVLVSRKGILKEIKVVATKNEEVNYKLEVSEKLDKLQKKLLKTWLSVK